MLIQLIQWSKIQWEDRVQRESARRNRQRIKKETREKGEYNVDTSDPHDRRVKNEIDERSIRVEREDQRWMFLFFFLKKQKEKACSYAPVDSRNIFARLTKALSQRLLVSPTKDRHFSPTYFPRSPSPSSVATFSVSPPVDRNIFRIVGYRSMEIDCQRIWHWILRISNLCLSIL